jgi:hypothetical protein
MKLLKLLRLPSCIILLPALLLAVPARGQSSDPKALAAVRAAVASELSANQTDKSNWMYRDHDSVPGKDAVYQAVETPQGELRRMIELNGKPLSGSAEQEETGRINEYVGDSAAQARARRNGAHDDKQATAMLKMLPDAFLWTPASEEGDLLTLDFRPNPQFNPPDMQARVMGTMAGQMVIARNGNRIRTLKGKLTEDVLIGWGVLGKLNEGGTFDVERREIAPGHWQITETHVHIGGHALLFKTIGQQEDEQKTEWKPSTDATLKEAAHTLGADH